MAVSRNGYDCTLYINGQASGHSISTVSVVYKNAFLAFGMDYQNKSSYFEGPMDHIGIYSQSLSESNINYLYNAEVGSPTAVPTPVSSQTITNGKSGGGSSNSEGGCNTSCVIATVCSVLGTLATLVGVIVAIYYSKKN